MVLSNSLIGLFDSSKYSNIHGLTRCHALIHLHEVMKRYDFTDFFDMEMDMNEPFQRELLLLCSQTALLIKDLKRVSVMV